MGAAGASAARAAGLGALLRRAWEVAGDMEPQVAPLVLHGVASIRPLRCAGSHPSVALLLSARRTCWARFGSG